MEKKTPSIEFLEALTEEGVLEEIVSGAEQPRGVLSEEKMSEAESDPKGIISHEHLTRANACGFPYIEASKYWPLNWIPIIRDELEHFLFQQRIALWMKQNPGKNPDLPRIYDPPKLSRVYEFFAGTYQRITGKPYH
ncbi:hypothetical protein J4427_00280 [Candidatus Woesearchaeota archaeon]|nr:hypothetical protein [Candidatus Woesearchaeota archaeon]